MYTDTNNTMIGSPQSQTKSFSYHNPALRLLHETNQILLSTRSIQPVLTYLAQEMTKTLNVEGCLIWLQDRDAPESLVCRSAFHIWLDCFQDNQRLHPGEGAASLVTQTGSSLMLSEIPGDFRTAPDINALGSGTVRTLLIVPLLSDDSPIGVLEFVNKTGRPFHTGDQELAESLAESAAVTIGHALLIESMECQIDDLQRRNEDLDAFAHSVAHDLQNPLSQVVGFAELLQFKLEALSVDERKYVADALVSSATKMSNIIQELLLLASVRKAEVTVEPLVMQDIVAGALRRLNHMITDSKAEIILPETWPMVYGYAPWVEEIWENYLSNALKYGGSPPCIQLGSQERPYGMVQFYVRDNGEGFNPDVEEQLFAPFAQLRQKTSHHSGGHGLGLSIVRRIVEKLGGTVAAECIQGQGSVFSFTLPRIKEAGD